MIADRRKVPIFLVLIENEWMLWTLKANGYFSNWGESFICYHWRVEGVGFA